MRVILYEGGHLQEWSDKRVVREEGDQIWGLTYMKVVRYVGEDVERRELSYIAGGSENWCSHYGKQYGESSKN